MLPFQRLGASASAVILIVVLSACSGPADETPVSLLPGQYSTKSSSAFASGESLVEVCLSSGSGDDAKIERLMRSQFALYDNCTYTAAERVGNAISGSVSCKIDETAGMNTVFEGRLTRESVTIDAEMTSYGPALGSTDGETEEVTVSIPLTATRIGDCN